MYLLHMQRDEIRCMVDRIGSDLQPTVMHDQLEVFFIGGTLSSEHADSLGEICTRIRRVSKGVGVWPKSFCTEKKFSLEFRILTLSS